jgi:two-component sensor histidine kinase
MSDIGPEKGGAGATIAASGDSPYSDRDGAGYRFLFDNISEGFAVCEALRDENDNLVDYAILEINPALQNMLGVGPEVVGTKLSASGNNTKAWLDLCDGVLRSGTPARFEFDNRQTGRWHDIRITRLTDDRMAQFFHDITERKIAEERQRRLFEEINHRVKNNLAMVSSVLRLQARDADTVARDQLLKAVGRVQSISEVYRTLYGDGQSGAVNFGTYLEELCRSLAASLIDNPERITLKVDADRISVPVDTAVSLGMVVNELVTNAVKYAYPPPQRGEITVRFRTEPECVLEVGDSGAGLPNGVVNSTIGLGMKLVTSLVQQAGGELSVKHHPGVTYTIRFAATADNQGGGAPA